MLDVILVSDRNDPESVELFVDGSIGNDPVRFLVDTGAAFCAVPANDYTTSLCIASANVGVGASGIAPGDDIVIVPELVAGPVTFTAVHAARVATDSIRRPAIGMSALNAFRCDFRFSANVIEINGPTADDAVLRDMEVQPGGQPMLPVQFGGVTANACWDSGASLTVVSSGFADAHPHLFVTGEASAGTDSAGVSVPSIRALMTACNIDGVEFAESAAVVVDLSAANATLDRPMDLIVGMPLIAQRDWFFDFPNQRWSTH